MSGDPRHDGFEIVERFGFGRGRPTHDDNLDLERARRLDLGVSCTAAAILGHQHLDPLIAHELQFVGEREGPARQDELAVWQGVDLGGSIDCSHDVAMLPGSREGGELQPALRKKDGSRGGPENVDGLLDCRDFDPAVVGLARPGLAGEHDERRIGCLAGRNRVGGHARSERMGRVDNRADAFAGEKHRQALGAAKAANALGDRRMGRIGRHPRPRQDCRNTGLIGDPPPERARFRRAAENEQAKALQWAAP